MGNNIRERRINSSILQVVIIFLVTTLTRCHHYKGGTITWKAGPRYNDSFREIVFSFRISLAHSRKPCNNATISSRVLIGNRNQNWICSKGCVGSIGSARIRCEDFNEELDYTTGGNVISHVFNDNGPFEISYTYCCWANMTTSNKSSRWGLSTFLLLGQRNDTNTSNSAPVVTSPLLRRLKPGHPAVIDLNIYDVDDDVIKCRLGNNIRECGDVCSLDEGFTLDQNNCQILYDPLISNLTGSFPFSIMVEDFNKDNQTVQVGEKIVKPREPLSSVPFQFIIQVEEYEDTPKIRCENVRPNVTLMQDYPSSKPLRPGMELKMRVVGKTCGDGRIANFIISGVSGISRNEIPPTEDGHSQEVLSWRPMKNEIGSHLICAIAVQADGLKSKTICSTILVQPDSYYCRAFGGSLLETFDGHHHNISGRGRYQLSTTTFFPSQMIEKPIEPFNISMLTNIDDVSGVSEVEKVFITIENHNIEIHKNKKILIHGSESYPPIRLDDLRIDLSGFYVRLLTSTGVVLRFGGNSTLSLGLPHNYMGFVEGLCGNFNDDSDDDAQLIVKFEADAEQNSARIPAKLNDDSLSNSLSSVRAETSCSEQEKLSNSRMCSILMESGGCFQDCHNLVKPDHFFDTCMAHLCSDSVSTATRHLQLSAYAETCQLENARICDWRQSIGEAVECPANSHFVPCAPSVPATCVNIDDVSEQPTNCVEGCTCDEGYVLSGADCVPQSSCGCFIKGSYRMRGFTYRLDDCMHECTCVGRNRSTCSPASPCDDEQRCGALENDFMGCVARTETPANCKIIGDPHYQTFDGAVYDSMSTCAHVLVRSRSGSPLPPFSVIGVNEEPRLNNYVSHVKEVQISVGGDYNMNITLSQNQVIQVNGERIVPGSNMRGVQTRMTSVFLVVTFDFGLVIRWDGVDRLRISAWSSLKGQVEGLCGNYDGNPSNDYAAADGGGLITDVEHFVASWLVVGPDLKGNFFPEPPLNATETCFMRGISGALLNACLLLEDHDRPHYSCRSNPPLSSPSLCNGQTDLIDQFSERCFILIDPEGPFKDCPFDGFAAFSNCRFDLCAYNGSEEHRIRIISSYEFDCRQNNISVSRWRNVTDSQVVCEAGSEYSDYLNQCEPTCGDPDGMKCRGNRDMGEICEEGCRCMDGLIRSAGERRCIPVEECGCVVNEIYIEKGSSYLQNNCTETCMCMGNGNVACASTPHCGGRSSCNQNNLGFQHCSENLQLSAICTLESNLTTFDGTQYFPPQSCSYVMARSKVNSTSTQFTLVINRTRDTPHTPSIIADMIVYLGGNKTIRMTSPRQIKVNDISVLPGYKNNGLEIRTVGKFIVVDFNFGLSLQWDGITSLKVSANQELRHQLEGLCGSFDNNPLNDFLSSNGEVQQSSKDFIMSWARDDADKCEEELANLSTSSCNNTEDLFLHQNICFILIDSNGLLNSCQSVTSAENLYRSCVMDHCAYTGDPDMKGQIISSYMSVCLGSDMGAMTGPPRELLRNLTMQCPANMVYSTCLNSCPPTCENPLSSRCSNISTTNNTCSKGCECAPGYVMNDDSCVPLESCGCWTVEGHHRNNNATWMDKNCSVLCSCREGNITCEDYVCGEDMTCVEKDDEQGCYKNKSMALCTDEATNQKEHARWRKEAIDRWEAGFQRLFSSFRTSLETEDNQTQLSVCGAQWTPWMDRDDPEGEGDDERLDLLQRDFPNQICRSPSAIEARLADGRPATLSGNHVTMSPELGLLCNNAEQSNGMTCSDFQVRFLCLGSWM